MAVSRYSERPPNEELVRMYVEEQMSLRQIGRAVNISASSVRNLLLSEQVKMRPGPSRRRLPLPPDGELRRLYVDERLTMEQIGEHLGVSPGQVGLWMRQEGIAARGWDERDDTREGIYQEIVSEEDRPYDTTFDGTVLSVKMDVLACGHKVIHRNQRSKIAIEYPIIIKKRRCRRCEKEQGQ